MYYCEKCSLLDNQTTCTKCKKEKREVRDDDFILIGRFSPLKANMIEPILKDNNIPYIRKAKQGSGLTAQGGGFLEEIALYLTYEQYEKAMELIFPFLQ